MSIQKNLIEKQKKKGRKLDTIIMQFNIMFRRTLVYFQIISVPLSCCNLCFIRNKVLQTTLS